MARPRRPEPVLLLVAAFSRHPDALAWGRQQLEDRFGPIALASDAYAFVQTSYYESTMGCELQKHLWAFGHLIDPGTIADIKLATNALEEELATSGRHPEGRPLNLDPGYLELGKLVLATTKNQAHRVYLRDGIFAEVTLHHRDGVYQPWPWTYADYRLPEVIAFLGEARTYYRDRLRGG